FENLTRLTARGESMTVAAVLAVLDQLGGRASPLFRAAVSLVELQPGGRLGSVAAIPVKLAAAHRECGDLTLVVCPQGIEFDRSRVAVVWEVQALGELPKHLHDAGLLEPLLDAVDRLTGSEAARVLDRLRSLVLGEQRYVDAADLGDRIRRCGFSDPP